MRYPAKLAALKPQLVSTPKSAPQLPAFARPKASAPSKNAPRTPTATHLPKAPNLAIPAITSKTPSAHAGIVLKMPPPPSSLSAAARARIGKAQNAADRTACAQATLPAPEHQVGEAQKAVTEPKEQANADAAKELVALLGKRQPPSLAIMELCKKIVRIVNMLTPDDEDDLVNAKPDDMAKAAGASIQVSVDRGVEDVHSQGYSSLQQTPAGVPNQIGIGIPGAPGAQSTPSANAAQAIPDAIPAKDVDLRADAADSQARIEQSGMNSAPAKLAQSGPIADARAAQDDLAQRAAEDPAMVLAAQHAALAKATSNMADLERSAMSMLQTSRKDTASNVHGQKKGMVVSEETMRREAGATAQGIFNKAQNDVNSLVTILKPTAMALWKAGVETATTKFKDILKKVDAWIKKRHSGIIGSTVNRLGDAIGGLPQEVQDTYDEAEISFAGALCKTAQEISSLVNTIVAACEARIAQANTDIAAVYAPLPKSLQKWAGEQQNQFGMKLAKLADHAHAVRDDFDKELVQSATSAMQDVHDQVQELREKAKGLVSKIADAVSAFLKDPAKFIINALLSLVGISPGDFWALVAKIKHVIKQIADDPVQFASNLMSAIGKGFSQFFGRFTTHLFKGFIKWLTGGLSAIGVEVPTDLSLSGILTFMLQLMGLTWPRIRERLAKQIGDKNVALIDKAFSFVATLIELGPAGIFKLIQQQLDPQNILDMIINAAVSFMETAIVKAIAEKVALLFIPGGAILEAIEGIYKVLKWIVHNAANIFTLIDTIVSGIADILAGNIGGMANAIEKALAMLIPPVIDFLADFFGLGDIPNKVRDVIVGLQEKVMGAVDKVIGWLIEKGKGLLAAVGIGKKEEPHKGPDTRTDEEKDKAKRDALHEAAAILPHDDFDEDVFLPMLLPLKAKYRLSSLELIVDSDSEDGETLHFTAAASPTKSGDLQKVKLKKTNIYRRSWKKDTLDDLAQRFPKEHKASVSKKTGNPLLKQHLARRHVVSADDMAQHYVEVLNKTTLSKAKSLLGGKGNDEAKDAGKVTAKRLTNKAIEAAAKNRHLAFFNLKKNLFVGDSDENSRIQKDVDPDHPKMKTKQALRNHVQWVRENWALSKSFEPSDSEGKLK